MWNKWPVYFMHEKMLKKYPYFSWWFRTLLNDMRVIIHLSKAFENVPFIYNLNIKFITSNEIQINQFGSSQAHTWLWLMQWIGNFIKCPSENLDEHHLSMNASKPSVFFIIVLTLNFNMDISFGIAHYLFFHDNRESFLSL